MSYIERNGSLSVTKQIEQAAGLISMVVNRSAGGKAELSDFLPDRTVRQDEDEGEPGTVEDVMALLKGLATPSKKAA